MEHDRPSLHVVPKLYTVYILQSIPKPRSFYIGSTPDPIRRLRQHNGDLKAGGAYRTSRLNFRPWRVICLVYGFTSKIAALQFEHALQHSYQTRHINAKSRVSSSKTSGITVHHKLANVRLLLNSDFFRSFKLKVCIVVDEEAAGNGDSPPGKGKDVKDAWIQNKFNIQPDVPSIVSSLPDFAKSVEVADLKFTGLFESLKSLILECAVRCHYCDKSINYVDEQPEEKLSSQYQLDLFAKSGKLSSLAITTCECQVISHLHCLANSKDSIYVDTFDGVTLAIPDAAVCPKCSIEMSWPDIVRVSTYMRHYFLKDVT